MEKRKIFILKEGGLDTLAEIDEKVLKENWKDYWKKKFELMDNKSSQISRVPPSFTA